MRASWSSRAERQVIALAAAGEESTRQGGWRLVATGRG